MLEGLTECCVVDAKPYLGFPRPLEGLQGYHPGISR